VPASNTVCDEWQSVKVCLNTLILKAWKEGFETINKNGFVIWNKYLEESVKDENKYNVDNNKEGHQKRKGL
jgi:hypothetical protein